MSCSPMSVECWWSFRSIRRDSFARCATPGTRESCGQAVSPRSAREAGVRSGPRVAALAAPPAVSSSMVCIMSCISASSTAPTYNKPSRAGSLRPIAKIART